MKDSEMIKRLMPYLLGSIFITTVVGCTVPRGLFITGGIIVIALWNKIYVQGRNSYLQMDISLFGSVLLMGSVSAVLLKGACFLLPGLSTCGYNQLRATILGFFLYPLMYSVIFWVFVRLPIVVRTLLKKK